MFVTNLNLQISHTIFTLSLRWQGEPLNRPGGQYETEMAKAKKKRKNRSMCATEYRLYQIITRGTKRKKKGPKGNNNNKNIQAALLRRHTYRIIKLNYFFYIKTCFFFPSETGSHISGH